MILIWECKNCKNINRTSIGNNVVIEVNAGADGEYTTIQWLHCNNCKCFKSFDIIFKSAPGTIFKSSQSVEKGNYGN